MLQWNVKSSDYAFPYKLHQILENASRDGFEHIVSWMEEPAKVRLVGMVPRGGEECANNVLFRQAFRVHKPKDFARLVMRKYFPQSTKYRSFQRQLNIWCFQRVEEGPLKNAYHHQFFVKGDRSLSQYMVRIKNKGRQAGEEPPPSVGCLVGRGDAESAPGPPPPSMVSAGGCSSYFKTSDEEEKNKDASSFFGGGALFPRYIIPTGIPSSFSHTTHIRRNENMHSTINKEEQLRTKNAIMPSFSCTISNSFQLRSGARLPRRVSEESTAAAAAAAAAIATSTITKSTTAPDPQEEDWFEGKRFYHPLHAQ
jgi:hypothetical protein